MSQCVKPCNNNLGELPVDERLNYVFGQVLGVQDFRQEQVYFIYKNRLHNRSLHGYGTVWGLAVTHDGTGENLQVHVDAGLAVGACGQEITVPSPQCALLNAWLQSETTNDTGETVARAATLLPINDAGARVGVYVTLCYAECLTGEQPVFGDPCRSDSEAIQPTRIKDDFRLNLCATPPPSSISDKAEEELVRSVGELLGHIKLGDEALALTPDELAALSQALRAAIDALPAQPADTFVLPPAEARELLRDMFRHWVVAKRPDLQPPEDGCILLARLEFTLTDVGQVDETQGIVINDAHRPYLLHTRLLQEWLLAGGGKGQKGDPGEDGVSVQSADAESVAPTDPAAATFDPNTGNIHFRIPRGEPGVSVRSADAESVAPTDPAAATFDPNTGNIHFRIPRGQPGASGSDSGIRQAFINPNMMISENGRIPALGIFPIASPAWIFPPEVPANLIPSVVFNWGRPANLKDDEAIGLRLFVAGTDAPGTTYWQVEWRWTTSIQTLGPKPPITTLDKLLPASPGILPVRHEMPDGNLVHLSASDFYKLAPGAENPVGELLTVRITLAKRDIDAQRVGLLLAELRW